MAKSKKTKPKAEPAAEVLHLETPKVELRKIAMIGTAPSTRSQAPMDSDWEIWTQADYWKDLKKVNRWFEFATMPKLQKDFVDYLEFLKTAKFPVFMRQHHEEIPASQPFPFDKIQERFGPEFMTATLCWMIGMAILEHEAGKTISHIGLWGYDMALEGEYVHQRPGIKHMQWVCERYLPALGLEPIQVLVPKGSDLLISAIPYPFAEDDPLVAKIRARKRDLQTRIAHTTKEKLEFEAKVKKGVQVLTYLEGAMEDVVYFERMATGVKTPAA